MSPTQEGSNVPTAERIRVLVADDEETVHDVLEALLGSESEIDLIGFAADTETAIELACKELPDALRRAGIRHAQGFLLGRPGPLAEVASGRCLEASLL